MSIQPLPCIEGLEYCIPHSKQNWCLCLALVLSPHPTLPLPYQWAGCLMLRGFLLTAPLSPNKKVHATVRKRWIIVGIEGSEGGRFFQSRGRHNAWGVSQVSPLGVRRVSNPQHKVPPSPYHRPQKTTEI